MTGLTDYLIERKRVKAKQKNAGNHRSRQAAESTYDNAKYNKPHSYMHSVDINIDVNVRTVFYIWVGSFILVGAFAWYITGGVSMTSSNAYERSNRAGGAYEYTSAFAQRHPGVIQYDRTVQYRKLREKYEAILPDSNTVSAKRRRAFVQDTARKRRYIPKNKQQQNYDYDYDDYDPFNCPPNPPKGYPRTYNALEVLQNWPPDDTAPPQNNEIYQGLCVFSFQHNSDGDGENNNDTLQKIMTYQAAEVPYVVRDDPEVLKTVERWGQPDYLKELLRNDEHITEYSVNNHFMYWQKPLRKDKKKLRGEGWSPPTKKIRMGYLDWLKHANATVGGDFTKDGDVDVFGPDHSHWYFRLIGCGDYRSCTDKPSDFLFDELPFFRPRNKENIYLVNGKEQQGMHCRFGMKGVIAENHFDASRNSIAILVGERRYILAHPRECENLALYPMDHPSRRHSAIDWSNPDLMKYPQFGNAQVNEIVLQAGDVLYLPTQW
eukprot:CAMPEP_0116020036 /NCGR_PEP_ID=MMETSP0321-20121206/9571_1 /TAXON_ID=163516 /ORGANISM="Leptocylindrus danicus var. danicus, Strain B650" /LENGTH=490 /DNA_ID=CAMNT_0003490677 /DNA_START=2936 /DNA_END=4405 /DNA_ORIENTATION=-